MRSSPNFFGNGGQLLLQDLAHQGVVGQHPVEVGDLLLQLVVLASSSFSPVQALQGLQAHIQNGLGLDLVQTEAGHQIFLGIVVALPDDLDDLVNVVLCDEQTLQQMGPLQGLVQVVRVRRMMISSWKARYSSMMCRRDRILGWRWLCHQCQHIDGEGGLQLGLGKQAVKHHLRIGVPLQLNDDAHTVAVGLVPMSEMPSSRLSSTCSAMFLMSIRLLT